MLLFSFFLLFLFGAVFQKPVSALPFDNEFTGVTIAAGDWQAYYLSVSSGSTISGYLETDSEWDGVDFFIAAATNYNLWTGGSTATVYKSKTNMHILTWSFDVPYSDTWYIVFSNTGGSSSITLDIGIDVDSSNAPYYSSADYDYTSNYQVLEPNEYLYLTLTINADTIISGHFSTFFPTDGVTFFICDASEFSKWTNGQTANVYGLKEDYHQAFIDSFEVPTSDDWYLVFSAEGQADTVTLSFGVNIDTSGAATTSPTDTGGGSGTGDGGGGGAADLGFSIMGILVIELGVVILLVVVFAFMSRRGGPSEDVEVVAVGSYESASAATSTTPTSTPEPTRCPYCGAIQARKAMPGETVECSNCGGKFLT